MLSIYSLINLQHCAEVFDIRVLARLAIFIGFYVGIESYALFVGFILVISIVFTP
jgi:hypothetical protein